MMTKTEFINWCKGKKLDYDGVPASQPYQCVDVFKFYIDYCYDIKGFDFYLPGKNPRGFARSIWENFDDYPQLKGKFIRVKNTPSFIPQKGDAPVWNTQVGEAGHIALSEGKKTDNTSKFTSLDQNWSKKYYVTEVNHSYNGLYGVIRPLLKCTTANLNVRSGAGTNYPVVDEIPKGTLVKPLGYNGNWAKIGVDRWVSTKYLD